MDEDAIIKQQEEELMNKMKGEKGPGKKKKTVIPQPKESEIFDSAKYFKMKEIEEKNKQNNN